MRAGGTGFTDWFDIKAGEKVKKEQTRKLPGKRGIVKEMARG